MTYLKVGQTIFTASKQGKQHVAGTYAFFTLKFVAKVCRLGRKNSGG